MPSTRLHHTHGELLTEDMSGSHPTWSTSLGFCCSCPQEDPKALFPSMCSHHFPTEMWISAARRGGSTSGSDRRGRQSGRSFWNQPHPPAQFPTPLGTGRLLEGSPHKHPVLAYEFILWFPRTHSKRSVPVILCPGEQPWSLWGFPLGPPLVLADLSPLPDSVSISPLLKKLI